MTGRILEGFDWLTTADSTSTIQSKLEAAGWYISPALTGGSIVSPGRWGYGYRLNVLWFNIGTWRAVRPIGSQNSAGGYVSAGLHLNAACNASPVLGVYDAVNNVPLVTVSFDANGVVRAWRGQGPYTTAPGVLLGASEPGCFDKQVDFDVEVFFKVNGSTGEVEVCIDTISVLHLVNVNTQPGANAYFDSVCFGSEEGTLGETADFSIDDFRYYDTAGSINNSWCGTCQVQTSLPAGNGSTTNFTRSNTGLANWQNIANTAIDDSLYLYDPDIGDANLNTVTPLFNAPTVFWVQTTIFARQDQATQMYVKSQLHSGSTTASGARFATTQTYSADHDTWELNPDTGLTFTGAQVNALQVGLLIVS